MTASRLVAAYGGPARDLAAHLRALATPAVVPLADRPAEVSTVPHSRTPERIGRMESHPSRSTPADKMMRAVARAVEEHEAQRRADIRKDARARGISDEEIDANPDYFFG